MADPPIGRRLKVEIIAEILQRLHSSWKTGTPATAYAVEKQLGLQGKRVRALLRELRQLRLIDDRLKPTELAYVYLHDYTAKILPFLEKFGLVRRRDLRSRR